MTRAMWSTLLGAAVLGACGDSSGPSGPQPVDFTVAFPANQNLTPDAALSLRIAGGPGVGGTVGIPGLGFATTFTTDAGGLATVTLPATAMLDAWDTVMARGVLIHADDRVSLLAISDKPSSMAPAVLLPAQGLGLQHVVLAGSFGAIRGSFLAVVGTQDNTTVTITPPDSAGSHAAGVAFQVTLQRGSAYQLEASDSTGDLTGSTVSSDKPVAVFGGHSFGQVPAGTCCAGVLWTAIPPTSAIGTSYFAWPLSSRTQYRVRLVGLQNGTTITSTGIPGMPTTLQSGQIVEAIGTASGSVTATAPVLIAQLAEGKFGDNADGTDPCLTLLPPVSAFRNDYAFATPVTQVATRFANIVAPSAAVGSIAHNGNVIASGNFTAIGSTGYSGATVSLTAGVTRITGTGSGFGVVAYGWDASGVGAANGFCFAP